MASIMKCLMNLLYFLFSNLNCATVEVCEWMSNFIKHFTEHVITYPCWDLNQSMLGPLQFV